MSDEAAVSAFSLEFSLTVCRPVYCSCVPEIPRLFVQHMALS